MPIVSVTPLGSNASGTGAAIGQIIDYLERGSRRPEPNASIVGYYADTPLPLVCGEDVESTRTISPGRSTPRRFGLYSKDVTRPLANYSSRRSARRAGQNMNETSPSLPAALTR